MQDCRGKRILELGKDAYNNKKPKVIVQSVVTLAPRNLEETLKQQIITNRDGSCNEYPSPRCSSTIPQNSQLDAILDNQATQKKAIDSKIDPVQSLSYIEITDDQNHISEEDESSDPFACSDDEDKNYELINENCSATDEEIEDSSLNRKKKSRWNKANKQKWARNITKKFRNLGQPYVTKKGPTSAKIPQSVDSSKYKFRCSEEFSEQERFELCSSYWQLEVYSRKKILFFKMLKVKLHKDKDFEKRPPRQEVIAKSFIF
ncbi:uncharacterized protein LOC126740517 [Anthonomus grandis grandis]|uniref:uncharacterized protein LOC126740517 n=1 Tax=Anthonomus grandis grandis TaxID=2921223 RepID=UPI00216536D9|nr:uncharacterized protein LOC126740517 [Anthonomus grandis grandis]